MAPPDQSWLQLPTWDQWEELPLESSYNPQVGSQSEVSYNNALFADALNTPLPSLDTTPPTPSTQPPDTQYRPRRQRRTVDPPRSETSSAGSVDQDAPPGHISQRRKSQNRASQRAFRQRRTERFQALQSRVTYLERQLDAAKIVNRMLAQMSGLSSLEQLRGRTGAGVGVRETGGAAREPPACEEGAGFQTCDLPLLDPGLGRDCWEEPVLVEGGLETGDWQAVGMGDRSFSSASRFGGVPDGAGLA